MKKPKLVYKEEEVIRPDILFARLECMSCHEHYYARTDDPETIVIPDFLTEREIFSANCPVCEHGRYAMLTAYLEY